jgi:hypothetical protein
MPCYIHRKYWFGVKGDLDKALADPDAPTTHEGDRLTVSDFEPVSADEYDNDAILDLRYEDGEWQQ